MKTRKLLFTMITVMTMMFGLTLTANAEEAPATKVVGVEGIGTFTVPADWTEEYIEGYGTYWFNPTKTAYVALDYTDRGTVGHPSIEALAATYRSNLEAYGCTFIDWHVTEYFGNDAVYGVGTYPGDNNFSVNYPVLNLGGYSCGYTYYFGNRTVDNGVSATTVEELQTVLPILATYQPVK